MIPASPSTVCRLTIAPVRMMPAASDAVGLGVASWFIYRSSSVRYQRVMRFAGSKALPQKMTLICNSFGRNSFSMLPTNRMQQGSTRLSLIFFGS